MQFRKMGSIKNIIKQISLTDENKLSSLVENKTTFTLKNCEFTIYETHKNAKDFQLQFSDLAFTSMLRGRKNLKIEGKSEYFDYLPGESIIMSPGETMLIDFPEAQQQPSQCIALSLNMDFVENALNYLNLEIPKIDENSTWELNLNEYYLFNTPSLALATNNIMRIAMDDNSHKDMMADFAIKELLIRLMQTQARNLVEKNLEKNKSRISFITEFIKSNLHQKLSADQIAKIANVSKSNFFKLFKQELGMTPNEFILKERISKAKSLLMENESIKEVAYQTGFSDTNYFTRAFRQIEGITPKNFQLKKLN